MSTRVKVSPPFQVNHDGKTYGPGETVAVPDELAERWITAGWVEEAPTRGRSRSK